MGCRGFDMAKKLMEMVNQDDHGNAKAGWWCGDDQNRQFKMKNFMWLCDARLSSDDGVREQILQQIGTLAQSEVLHVAMNSKGPHFDGTLPSADCREELLRERNGQLRVQLALKVPVTPRNCADLPKSKWGRNARFASIKVGPPLSDVVEVDSPGDIKLLHYDELARRVRIWLKNNGANPLDHPFELSKGPDYLVNIKFLDAESGKWMRALRNPWPFHYNCLLEVRKRLDNGFGSQSQDQGGADIPREVRRAQDIERRQEKRARQAASSQAPAPEGFNPAYPHGQMGVQRFEDHSKGHGKGKGKGPKGKGNGSPLHYNPEGKGGGNGNGSPHAYDPKGKGKGISYR